MKNSAIYKGNYRRMIVFSFLFVLCFLVGCGKIDIEYALENESSPTSAEDEDGLHNTKEDLLVDGLLVSGHKDLYDLTSVLPANVNGSLVTYGLLSPKKLCLVYQHRDVGGKCDYFVKSLNLATGEVEDIYNTWTSKVDDEGNAPYIGILSANPLVLVDYSNNLIYRPENEGNVVTKVTFEHLGATFCVYEGELYSVEGNGLICRITDAGEFETVFHIPDSYKNVWISKSDDSHFIRVDGSTYLGDFINIYLDPKTKKYKVYQGQDQNIYFCGSWKDKIYGTHTEAEGEAVTLCDQSAGEKREFLIQQKDYPTETYMELNPAAVCGNAMVLGFVDFDSRLQNIYYWDSSEAAPSEWKVKEKVEYNLPEVDDDELKEKADEIEEKYGIQVAYGENVVTEISDYTFEKCTNKGEIMEALNTLDETFALYPDGIFEKIEEGYHEIVVYLTGAQAPKNAMEGVTNTQGVTTQENGFLMVLLDVDTMSLSRAIIVHEFTHVMDRKLEYDYILDDEEWKSFNPEDFTYHYSYVSESGEQYSGFLYNKYTAYYDGAYDDNFAETYFYDEYAMTWPTEDRARLMENLIGYEEYTDPCYASLHLQEKLKYYFAIIRQDFGDDTWPEQTEWEKKLSQYTGE